tara:strand:- start:78 stop:833 length:756 start_codon:yes stop_codon:yes gene_type:complete
MKKFNYKKWVVENKYGKVPFYSNYSSLSEQNTTGSITGSVTGSETNVTGSITGSGTIPGCMDLTACNFNDTATIDDGSCTYPEAGYDCDGMLIDPTPVQTYGNVGSTLDGDTCPENAMSIILDTDGVSFNFNMYCVTVDGQTPQVGDIVISTNGNQGEIIQTAPVGSGQITGTGGNAIFNLQLVSSGLPEPEGQPFSATPQGLTAPNTGPQPQGKKRPISKMGRKRPRRKIPTRGLREIKELIKKEIKKLK